MENFDLKKYLAEDAESKKLASLKDKRAEIMRDMEQEAEMEGGPVADRYGDMLNKLDKAIAMLQGQGEWGPETNPYMSKDEIERRAAMIGLEEGSSTIGFGLEEGAADNLEIKSLAKTLYSGFKKMGADVELTASKMTLNKRPSNGNQDSKNVFIYAGDEAVEVNLVGEKAGGFFDKIQKDFPKFEFKDRGDSKTWEDKTVKNLAIYPGKGMSEALNEEVARFQKLAGIIK